MAEDEVIWLKDESPHDPLAEAIYTELHFERYNEYIKLGAQLKKLKRLEVSSNQIQINFELTGQVLKIEYLLPGGESVRDFADINLRPKPLQNSVEQQLLLQIAQAETNALMYTPVTHFKLYIQPAIGFGKQLTFLGKIFFKIRNALIK